MLTICKNQEETVKVIAMKLKMKGAIWKPWEKIGEMTRAKCIWWMNLQRHLKRQEPMP